MTQGAAIKRCLGGRELAIVMALLLCSAGCGGGSGGNSRTSATTAQSAARSAGATGPLHPPVQSVPAGDEPHDVVVAAGRIWVADFGGPMREFDLHGHQLRKIAVDAQSLAAGPDGVWAGELSNSNTDPQGPFAEVDARTGRVARRLITQHSVDLIAVGDGAVWVASHFAARIVKVPLSGGPQRSFRLPGVPTGIAARRGAVWVAFGQSQTGLAQAAGEPQTGRGGVVKLDPASGSQVSVDSEADVPTALLVAHGTVWVALAGDSNAVDRIDETSGQSLSSTPISVGNQPTDLAFGDGSVWALNYSDGTVTRIDPASGRVSATIAFAGRTDPDRLAANTPIRLAVTPGTLWVTDAAANTLHRLADR